MTHDEPAITGRPAQLRFSVEHWAAFWASSHQGLAGRMSPPVSSATGRATPSPSTASRNAGVESPAFWLRSPDLRLEVAEYARN